MSPACPGQDAAWHTPETLEDLCRLFAMALPDCPDRRRLQDLAAQHRRPLWREIAAALANWGTPANRRG